MIRKIKQNLNICKATFRTLLVNRSNTYCHMLWDSVFINEKGDVYICCSSKPGIIGNIYKRDLFSIWNKGIKLKIFRLMSLNKCLRCFDSCDILSKKQKQETKDSIINNPSYSRKCPSNVWILYGLRCNLRCTMCSQDHRAKITLDNNILKKNIDWSQVEDIEFQGGEILAMKNAKEMYIWLTEQMNKKVNLITNGTLINDEWAARIVKGSKWIAISVNAVTKKTHEIVNKGSKYERVIDNIKNLIHLKYHYNSNIIIDYKYTIVPENISEIADAIEFADSLGCDSITYGFSASVPRTLRENKELGERMKSKIYRLVNGNLKIEITEFARSKLERLGLLENN